MSKHKKTLIMNKKMVGIINVGTATVSTFLLVILVCHHSPNFTSIYSFHPRCASFCCLSSMEKKYSVFLQSYVPKTSGCFSNTLGKTRKLIFMLILLAERQRAQRREEERKKGGRGVKEVKKRNILQLLIRWIGLMQNSVGGSRHGCAREAACG